MRACCSRHRQCGRRGAVADLVFADGGVVPAVAGRRRGFRHRDDNSVRAVVMSPVPMIGWAAVIVVLLIVSALPYFSDFW